MCGKTANLVCGFFSPQPFLKTSCSEHVCPVSKAHRKISQLCLFFPFMLSDSELFSVCVTQRQDPLCFKLI